MAIHISHSPEETQALGEACGRAACAGEVIALCGDLGAGKTQWVKGLARGLGFAGRVSSPTFTLVQVYSGGRLTLFHLDLYRLEKREQILSAGLEEYLRPAGVAVIEWAERWGELRGALGVKRGESRERRAGSGAHTDTGAIMDGIHILDGSAPSPGRVRWVQIEAINEAERRIIYDNPGH